MATKEICDSCLRGEQEILARTWCSDCEEKLCESCDKAHRVGKLTFSHHLNELRELLSVPKNTTLESDLCESHQKPLDFFCTFHDVVCCRVCIPASHKACDNIEPIDDVCKNIKSSALVENLLGAFSSLLETTNCITLSGEKNITNVKQQKGNIVDQITSLKTNVTTLLNTLEQTLLNQLDELYNQTASDLDSETNKFKQLREKLEDMKQELDFCIRFGSNRKMFLLAQILRQRLSVEDASVQDFLTRKKRVDLDYSEDNNMSTILSNLAKVRVVNTNVNITHTSVVQKGVQSVQSLLSFTSRNPIDLSVHGITSITAIEIIDHDRLLLCSCQDKSVLSYKQDGTFLLKNDLDGNPYQIAVSQNKDEAAITLSEANKIVIIDTDSLTVIRKICTHLSYQGIVELTEITGLIVGENKQLNMISLDGTLKHSISLSGGGLVRFIQKQKGGTLLCTDSHNLVCVDLLNGSEIFRYIKTTEARGIEQDRHGYIYVADMNKNEIHRVKPDGTFVDIVLTETNDILNPVAMKFSRDKSRLYVGLRDNDHLAVFDCK